MPSIHYVLLTKLFTIQLDKNFSIERRRSPSHDRYYR